MTEKEIRLQIEDSNLNFYYISRNQSLSENFIREIFCLNDSLTEDHMIWDNISQHQDLSENFIREFQNKLDWVKISSCQNLSEDFIREFQDKLDWFYISSCQTLSEDFIREFKDKVYWNYISKYQNLSEDFIREFQDKLDWFYISFYQNLSEDFIREFENKVFWDYISSNQNLSEDFRKEFGLDFPIHSWRYKTDEEKIELVKNTGLYEIEDNCVIAYKSVRLDFSSTFKRGIYYHVGNVVSAHCDCGSDIENSFGLSAWTKENALKYYDRGLLLKVKIPISKLGCLVYDTHKIRCFELEVLEVVEK
jgi:hypothetical protein